MSANFFFLKKDSSPKVKATRTTTFVKNLNYYVYQTGGLISAQWELNGSLAREFGNRCNRLRNSEFPFTEWLYNTRMAEMTPKIKSSGVKETHLNETCLPLLILQDFVF